MSVLVHARLVIFRADVPNAPENQRYRPAAFTADVARRPHGQDGTYLRQYLTFNPQRHTTEPRYKHSKTIFHTFFLFLWLLCTKSNRHSTADDWIGAVVCGGKMTTNYSFSSITNGCQSSPSPSAPVHKKVTAGELSETEKTTRHD